MKTIRPLILSMLALFVLQMASAQKRALDHEDILKWNRITEQGISNTGEHIVYKVQPWKGDPTIRISDRKGKEIAVFPRATGSTITHDSKWVVFTIKPATDTVRALKLKKTKKNDLPKDQLGIFHLETKTTDTIPDIKNYAVPREWSGVIAYQQEVRKEQKKTEKDSVETTKEEGKKESDDHGRILTIRSMQNGSVKEFPFVTQYRFAEKAPLLVYYSTGDEADVAPGLYYYHIETDQTGQILAGDVDIKQLLLHEDGTSLAFLADIRKEAVRKKDQQYHLYWSENFETARKLADHMTPGIPDGYEISANGRLSFSPSGQRIFLGLAPKAAEKDTTVLAEELPVVDVWHWNEPELQTVQIKQKNRNLRQTYQAVYHLTQDQLVLLQEEDIQGIRLINEGDADQVVAYTNLPYAVQSMWEGSPNHLDVYLVDIFTGKKTSIKKDLRAYPQVSPAGQYLYWHNSLDTTWNTYEIATGQERIIASNQTIQTANELNDIPNPPGSYGSPGWLRDDQAVLVYDRYNIWQLDPKNEKAPENLTSADPEKGITYRIIDFDRRESSRKGIDPEKIQLLSGHNEITREDGYFTWSMSKRKEPKALLYGPFSLNTPQKAKNADIVVFTQQDFQTFPDLQVSDLRFKNPVKISEANPQQKEFLWGTAELVSWTSLDGRQLEGLLYKPENFDPSKKYPLLVNFYEKSSQGLYNHRIPERHRSTIDYHYYTSNGYLIFNPDIYYKEGYPGEDAFNCVMPGITSLIDKGFVDEKSIGAQGHSWGGYQVAYLATRTQLFAAIESGAPVVNMFSAYGGIRWGSGLNRSFQYEHTQSRIGKSIWESPLRYLENSPLFTLDKVTTPILIMHNDDDGAVPWYQGIEFFIGLRRLGKPAWMLNYNNADHWPTRLEDKHDFQIRMAQFFDHYLKGAPMPEWMEKGIPATEKGQNFGY